MPVDVGDASVAKLPATRIPLHLPRHFSWYAVAAVMAEKFGLRGLRIAFMIGVMIVYLWWRSCDLFICTLLYIFAAATLFWFVITVWTAKESLDTFAKRHAGSAWLILDADGVGGESAGQSFRLGWSEFRRIVERNRYWLLETNAKGWMVLPTTHFTAEAWAIMRHISRQPIVSSRR
jgi:YcxB-like protein